MAGNGYEKNRLILMNKLLIKGRWIYIFGVALVGVFSKIAGGPNVNFSASLMAVLGIGICSLNIIYSIYFYNLKNISYRGVRMMSFINLTADFFFYLIVIFFAGGLISISFIYFFFNIIASAFFYSTAGVMFVCGIAGILYACLIILQYLEILPFFSRYGIFWEYYLAHNYASVATNLIAIILSFYVVGLFSGLIAKSLRQKEREIRIKRDREKFIDEMKSEFIMIAGHQLRTPLSAIKSALALLVKNEFGKISTKQKNVLEQCYDRNERLIKLVNDLLRAYSVEEGRFHYQAVETDISELVKQIAEKFKVDAKDKKRKFIFEIDNNLPKIKIDPYKIKLVLISIIDNAFRYTAENGEIKFCCSAERKNIAIKVEDNGIGIPEQSQNGIFSKFYRADNAISFQTEGNGLELYVAKNIVENHGGKIWFKSKVNKGSAFYIELPIKQRLAKGREYLTAT